MRWRRHPAGTGPASPRHLLDQADAARDRQDWHLAVELYTAYLATAPARADIWVQLGHARKESGAYGPSRLAYEQARTLAPDCADVHLQFGHLLKITGHHRQAAQSYARAAVLDPGCQDARREFGFLDGGKFLSSPAGPAADEHPGDTLSAADAARDAGDWLQAARRYDAYLDATPEQGDIWIQLGHARKELGQFPAARRAYRQAVRLLPGSVDAHLHLGHALKLLDQAGLAAEAYAQALALHPPGTEAYRELVSLGRRKLAEATVLATFDPARPGDGTLAARKSGAKSGDLAIFTICCANYLAQAAAFVASARQHYPDARLFLCLAEREHDPTFPIPDGCHVVLPSELGIRDFESFAFRYTVTEFSTAIKPAMFAFLLRQYGFGTVLYFDPDVQIFARSRGVLERLQAGGSFALTPHLCHPPGPRGDPDEIGILRAGAFNLGFLGVQSCPESDRLVDWWVDQVQFNCLNRPDQGLFVDQRFLDLAPGLGDSVQICRSPALNVGYWNLSERRLDRRDGEWLVDGQALEFFHFSGFDPHRPWRLSKHTRLFDRPDDPHLDALVRTYADQLLQHGYDAVRQSAYSFGRFSDGAAISDLARRYFADNHLTWPDPFGAFEAELLAPAAGKHNLDAAVTATKIGNYVWDRFQPAILQARREGSGAVDFADWIETAGASLLELDPAFVARLSRAMRPTMPARRADVCVIGYLGAASGVGEIGRRVLAGMTAAGLRAQSCDVGRRTAPLGGVIGHLAEQVEQPDAATEMYVVNADQILHVLRKLGRARSGARRILVPFWELERFPPEWVAALEAVDEVWAPTRFVQRAISAATSARIRQVPVWLPCSRPRPQHGREHFGLPPDRFVVLLAFDFLSFAARKNPMAAIAAFQRASQADCLFGAGATLVIKTLNAAARQEQFAALHRATDGLCGVSILDQALPATQNSDLLAQADCVLSLHRSEGLGLLVADAMAAGVPVIATGYSATEELLSDATGYPVRFTMVPVRPGEYPLSAGATWAEPDAGHAAEQLLRVFHDRDEAAQRAEAAKRHLAAGFSLDAVSRLYCSMLEPEPEESQAQA